MEDNNTTTEQNSNEINAGSMLNTIPRRSEIVFLMDAIDCNPNGDPSSPTNMPRIDTKTDQGIITPPRLKRYLRDELHANSENVYIANIRKSNGDSPTRSYLAKRISDSAGIADIIKDEDNDEYEMSVKEAVDAFLDHAIDARLFGATFSLDTDSETNVEQFLSDRLPSKTGAVQFAPGKTIHPVELNETYDSLTSVIATGDDKDQGGYQLSDKRIKYGLFRFNGVVDPNRARDTRMTVEDLEMLDDTLWNSIKNQTTTASKYGQEPLLYCRVEYNSGETGIARLGDYLTLAEDKMNTPVEEIRKTQEVIVDMTGFLDAIEYNNDSINTVHLKLAHILQAANGDEIGRGDEIISWIESAADAPVNQI